MTRDEDESNRPHYDYNWYVLLSLGKLQCLYTLYCVHLFVIIWCGLRGQGMGSEAEALACVVVD